MTSTAITLTARTTVAMLAAPGQLDDALTVIAELDNRRRPAGYFLPAELATVDTLVAAGLVRRFLDGREPWLELTDLATTPVGHRSGLDEHYDTLLDEAPVSCSCDAMPYAHAAGSACY